MHVLIYDDRPMAAEGPKRLLEQQSGYVVTVAEDHDDPVSTTSKVDPDIILLNVGLRIGEGLRLIHALREALATIPILVLSSHPEAILAERIVRAGANGYLMLNEAPDRLTEALHQAGSGGTYLSRAMRQSILQKIRDPTLAGQHQGLDGLSDRELEVFQLIGRGYNTQEVATTLHLSAKTIATHRAHIKKKLDLTNNTVLINVAARQILADKAE